ncbi:hypothetical protein GGR51DRAFT_546607 [Nemania sp. FL0031]|nr:hypothetical protein GGR51DRAFT_546607 [Nemania sp. FL0031]
MAREAGHPSTEVPTDLLDFWRALSLARLQRLPYELVAYIVESLDIEDVFNWSLCSKHFEYIIREDRFCKPVVAAKVPGTLEAQQALEIGGFSRALRRVAKRRSALSQASPYFLGIVACADSYEFFEGKLCYIIEARPQRWLRILDTNKSTSWELVVDIPMLIRAAVPQASDCRKYKFKVLYQAAGIVSCLFSFATPDTENWLLIINPQTHQILSKSRLDSIARIFVRNNDRFLYYGTHSWEGADGLRKWVLKGFDLNTLSWLTQPRMYLANLAGSDIGSTVCFEIFGDYFYGLSNQSLFEADDPEWASHYYCFRFPLNEPRLDKFEIMIKEDSWRRNHSEGPIDDRWGFLSLEIDETSGNMVILECRKEWLRNQRGSKRTYYTTDVVFREGVTEDQGIVRTATRRRVGDYPQWNPQIPFRRPEYVHAGDDSSVASLLVRSKTHFCAYIRSCQTFIDLIDETSTETPGPQQLRLRTGYRRLPGTPLGPDKSVSDTSSALSEPQAQGPYQGNRIFIWPPNNDSLKTDSTLDTVRRLLNVNDDQICTTATGDERSVIYATCDGSKGGVKALVLVSFDPAVHFKGMEHGGNILGQRVSDEEPSDANNRSCSPPMLQFSPKGPLGAVDTASCSRAERSKNLSSIDATASSIHHFPPPLPRPPGGEDSWATYTPAMHLEIPRKLYFGQ